MSLKSTGLATHLAITGSIKSALDNGILYLFSGPVPLSADAAIDGASSMLAMITLDGDGSTGLTFEATAPGGVLRKTTAEAWSGTIDTTGTVTFYRFCESGDNGQGLSTTLKRVQGVVDASNASDGVLVSTALVAGQTQNVSIFQIS